mmetsp:Transcript_1384/g.1867  ORF Transcript_1384/g.1867 Transcript_1384/m.1867 type:complete len:207 (+) Transcript_1384:1-621(+)
MKDTGDVPVMAFLISLCPLACRRNDTFRSFFSFTLEFFDLDESGFIMKNDLVMILESLNLTVSFLGDKALADKQIQKIVQEMHESMSLIQKKERIRKLSHDDVVTMLAIEPWIRKVLAQKLDKKRRVKFAPSVQSPPDLEELSTTTSGEEESSNEDISMESTVGNKQPVASLISPRFTRIFKPIFGQADATRYDQNLSLKTHVHVV